MWGVVLFTLLALAAADSGIVTVFVNNGVNPASLTLGQGTKKMKFSASEQSLDLVNSNGTVFSLKPAQLGSSTFTSDLVGAVEIKGDLDVTDLVSDDFEILSSENQLQNWLIAGGCDDTFTNDTSGWAAESGKPLSIQQCGGVTLLGGSNQLSSDVIGKTYSLPTHAEVQVTARFHFIDNWDEDTAWLKLDGHYMWTEQYSWCPQFFTMMCSKGHNACGQDAFPDRLSKLITVSMPHTAPTLTVSFGTTIPAEVPASEVSYGISAVTVEVR